MRGFLIIFFVLPVTAMAEGSTEGVGDWSAIARRSGLGVGVKTYDISEKLVEEFDNLNARRKSLNDEEYARFVELSGRIEIKEAAKQKFQRKFEVKFFKKTSFGGYLKEEFLHPSRGMEIFEGLALVGLIIFLLLKWFRRV